jgi:WD40 repeat protein
MTVAFNPDGILLLSGGVDQTVRLWDIDSGQCLAVLKGHESRVRSVAFSPDGKFFLSGGDDGAMKLWDSQSLQCIRTFIGERPYERMNITDAQGLTDAQKVALRTLGAIEIAKGIEDTA